MCLRINSNVECQPPVASPGGSLLSSQRISTALLIVTALAIASCSAQTESPQVELLEAESPDAGQALNRVDYLFSPAETAQLLSDPETAKEGVWAVLSNLGLGVYTSEAEQVLRGSETGPEDFWLYDFEVPILAEMAGRPPVSFENYHLFLSQFEQGLANEVLADEYAAAYQAHSEAWLVQLLNEMGVEISAEAEITPFVQWLLFVDAFVPPNGTVRAMRPNSGGVRLASLSARPQLQDDGLCDKIKAVATSPAWGAASTVDDLITMVRSGGTAAGGAAVYFSPLNLAHALMMSALVETTLEVTSNQVHELHSEGPFLQVPDRTNITAKTTFVLDVEKLARCGVLAGIGFDIPDGGPLEGMQIQWNFDPIFGEHGNFSTSDGEPYHNNLTDDQGEQQIVYQASEEAADGDGDFHHRNAKIEAVFRIQSADLFNGWAAVQEFFFPRTIISEVDIGWHEAAWLLIMTYELQQPGEFASITWEGLFAVGEDGKLDGEGTGTILVHSDQVGCAGGGQTGYDSEVSFGFEIGGQSRPRVVGEGNEFVLEISGTEHQATTMLSNPECEIDDENLFNLFFIGFAKDPNSFAVGNFILARAEPGKETINNTALGAPVIVSVETAGTGE